MAKSLKKVSDANELNNWVKNGQTSLANELQGNKDLAMLCHDIIKFVVRYIHAHAGLFLVIGDNNALFLRGSYGIKDKTTLPARVEFEAGSMKDAFTSKDIIVYDVDKDHEDSISAQEILDGTPTKEANQIVTIMIVPLVHEGNVLGSMKIRKIGGFQPEDKALLKAVSENISVTIYSAVEYDKKKLLMFKTSKQSRELELRTTQVETLNEFLSQKLEDLEKAKAASEAANIAKTEFTSVISHELRTPLTSIHGSLALLLGTSSEKFSESHLGLLEIAERNCNRLIQLINDILDIQKIESGILTLNSSKQDVKTLIETSISNNAAYANNFNMKIIYPPEQETATILADPNRFEQVMANLISNAVKFSPNRGSINISSKIYGDTIKIAVIDRGAGISENFREKLFTRFAQADSTDKRQVVGTGLGLFITKEIVEVMGGHIDYESEVNKGTTFFIDLPIVKA